MTAPAPPQLARWLRPGEVVVWCARPRHRVLRLVPVSPETFFRWSWIAAVAAVAVVGSASWWRQATGHGFAPDPRALIVLVVPALLVTLWLGIDVVVGDPRAYVLTRLPSGELVGYSTSDLVCLRFSAVGPPPTTEDAEWGDLVWSERELELLPSSKRIQAPVRWDDVPAPGTALDLLSEHADHEVRPENVARSGSGHVHRAENVAGSGSGHVHRAENVAGSGSGHVHRAENVAGSGSGHVQHEMTGLKSDSQALLRE